MPTQNALPLTITMVRLEPDFDGSPQEIADAIAAGLTIVAQQAFALFVTGSTAPSTDVGPWAKDGNTWYYFDAEEGEYVPFLVPTSRLGYQISVDQPTDSEVNVWFELSDGGIPLAINFRAPGSGGNFLSPYYLKTEVYTQAEVNAIAAGFTAQLAALTPKPVFVAKNAQNFTGNAAATKIVYEVVLVDEDNLFNTGTSRFTADVDGLYRFMVRVQWAVSAGAPTGIQLQIQLYINGVLNISHLFPETDETGAQTHCIFFDRVLSASQFVELYGAFADTGAATYELSGGVNQLSVTKLS